jgi:CheY-like chemotaxis protein
VNTGDLLACLEAWLPGRSSLLDDLAVDTQSSSALPDVSVSRKLNQAFQGHPLQGVKILVVDDDYRNIFAMTALLERGQASIEVAESGAEALAVLARRPVDIVLMDIMMPVMDGYDTIRAIRGNSQFDTVPIVAVTGKAAAGERQRCLDAGADDYIPKPVEVSELLSALAPWLPAPSAVST